MNETIKEYLRLFAEYEEKVFGYSEKIKKMVQMGDTHSQPAKLIYRGVIKL